MFRILLFAIYITVFFTGCGGSSAGYGRYAYHYIPGKTAVVRGGQAVAPAGAPKTVRIAIEAGNRIAGLPYGYGCGHTRELCDAYDCSGAASYVLCQCGLLDEPTTSGAFRNYGTRGKGRWITVYARNGHVFLVVAGLRFDTGWGDGAEGPRWTTHGRPLDGATVRHPVGL
jgi:hypothetical protein